MSSSDATHSLRALRHLALCALTLVACTADNGDTSTRLARVVRVVDGDTIVVRVAHRHETVRLIGIDTPETVKPDTPVECYGTQASALTARLLPEGTSVRLQRDVEARDDYGRLLAYVHRVSDDLFVNLALAEVGAARPLAIAPNTANADAIVAAAHRAKTARLGLWGACSR